MIMSSQKQRQFIGYLRKLLCISDDLYYNDILARYNVTSSKKLSFQDAEKLINTLKSDAINAGKFKATYYDKYNKLGYRKGMATEKQLRYVNVLWKQVSRQPTNELKELALNSFMKKITGKERAAFLTHHDIEKLVKAIEEMGKDNKDGN